MKVFGDAVYFIALLSARDRWHEHARAINQSPPGPLVTTEWILTEVGDAFSQPAMEQTDSPEFSQFACGTIGTDIVNVVAGFEADLAHPYFKLLH